MNGLFKVGTKLLGLSQLFTSFFVSFQIISFRNEGGNLATAVALSLLLFGFSLVLIFRTEWVASIVGITGSTEPSSISARSLLKVGIILVSLDIFLTKAHQIVGVITFLANNSSFQDSHVIMRNVVLKVSGDIVPIVLSLCFIFGSEKIIGLLEKCGTKIT
jgi:hypothetical protein